MSEMNTDTILIPEAQLHDLSMRVLQHLGLSAAHAGAMTRIVVAGQRDACQSHGAYRILSAAQTIRTGMVDLRAEPIVQPTQGAITRVDARKAFSPLALEAGLPHLVAATRQLGMGALVINHCFHFTALWPEVEMLTAQGLAALVMTPSHAWVAPTGGKRGVFGTNPIAFGWPRPGPHPYVFDFATSAIARGDLELHRRAGKPLPEGAGVDADGNPSTDPVAVAKGAMLTFGGHKGSALATMVELMAGALIGDLNSQGSMDFDAGKGGVPYHGHLLLAFDPQRFAGGDWPASQERAEAMFAAITDQGARLPSERRFAARVQSAKQGISMSRTLYNDIEALMH